MKRLWHNNSLSIVLLLIFLACFTGQAVSGWHRENGERADHGEPPLSFVQFLREPVLLEATAENWESEFLEMAMYVCLTAVLRQKGSAESKDPDRDDAIVDRKPDPSRLDAPWPVRRGGWILTLYQNSLTLALGALFLCAFTVHAVASWHVYRADQREHGRPVLSLAHYLGSSRLWFESFQNWQSEFLGVLTIVVLSIYLRQQSSPESKPVDAPHYQTGG